METFSFQFVNIFTFQTAARILHERLINMERVSRGEDLIKMGEPVPKMVILYINIHQVHGAGPKIPRVPVAF